MPWEYRLRLFKLRSFDRQELPSEKNKHPVTSLFIASLLCIL